ncbi:hypothetical protein ACGTNG_12500 [Halomonas sp. 1390]|uniref:hypothetical protein n=1 Tax=Halomonas sp. B23F22_3 TaxID=3459516 RepID=UPI00373E2EBC
MAGLLQQGMGQPAQPQPGGTPPPLPAPQGQSSPQPEPQQQPAPGDRDPRVDMDPEQGPQQRQALVGAMLEPLYGERRDQVLAMLEQQADQPAEAIGRVVSRLMVTAWRALSEQGRTVPPGVMFQAGMVAAQAVGEIAVNMGVLPEQGNAEPIEGGFLLAMGRFGEATAEQMPPEQRQRYGELIRAMQQARQQAGPQGGQPPRQPAAPRGPQPSAQQPAARPGGA